MSDDQYVPAEGLPNGGTPLTAPPMMPGVPTAAEPPRRTTPIDAILREHEEQNRLLNAPELEGRRRAEARVGVADPANGQYASSGGAPPPPPSPPYAGGIGDIGDMDGADDDVTGDIDPAPSGRRKKRRMNPLLEWLIVVAVAITSALLVRAYVVQQFAVEGESMMSTLHNGDRVLVNRLSYRLHDPRRGDVVVLRKFDAATSERDLIKRVIGLPGESVEVRSCVVYIDDVPLEEPYLDPVVQERDGCGDEQAEIEVPEGQVFVLGDHRGRSSDSRFFGPVKYSDLIGRAFVIIWPVGDWAWL